MRPEGKTLGLINASALLGPTEGGFFNGKAFRSIAGRAGRPDLQKRVDDLYATIGTAEADTTIGTAEADTTAADRC